ncbi:MAG: DUF3048 domain-containing protein [Firmicutes bacterium]|nr:DUF3048 domain-containing protein [Bacillota bacterium]
MKLVVKKKDLIILGVILLAIISGLIFGLPKLLNNNGTEVKENNKNNKVENNKEQEEIIPEVQIVDLNSKTRPYAVMVNNLSTARPYHSGLQDAYLVYEIIVEGGITRYLALFKDQETTMIGSVRSSRHYYLDYALENDAIYVHHGQSPQAQSDFSKLGIDRIEVSESKTGWREKLPVASEHTLFTSIEKLGKGIGSKRTELNKDLLLNYSATPIDTSKLKGVQTANKVDLKYSSGTTTNYVYDSENNVYKQYVNNKEHKDYKTGNHYTVKNIIAYEVENYSIDDYGRQNLKNIGSGKGYYITNGVAIPITWEKNSRSAQTIYKYQDGTEITVNDGNTWIHIVPKNGNISITY